MTHNSPILYQIWWEQTLSTSQVPACFAVLNDLMHWHEQTHLQILPNRKTGALHFLRKKGKISINTAHNHLSPGWFKYTSASFIPHLLCSCLFSTFRVITVFKQQVLSTLCKWNLLTGFNLRYSVIVSQSIWDCISKYLYQCVLFGKVNTWKWIPKTGLVSKKIE